MDIEEIMKLPPEKRPIRLERLAGWTIIPQAANAYFFGHLVQGGEKDQTFEEFFEDYKQLLESITFSTKRNYSDFRRFIKIFKRFYSKKQYNDLKQATNQEIDYIFTRVREIRTEALESEIDDYFLQNP